jgi:hypothetical protein
VFKANKYALKITLLLQVSHRQLNKTMHDTTIATTEGSRVHVLQQRLRVAQLVYQHVQLLRRDLEGYVLEAVGERRA